MRMTWIRWVMAVALVSAPSAGSAQAPSDGEARVRASLTESAAAWNRGDLKGHLADNADSISFMTGKGPVVGKDKTEESLRRAFFRDGRPLQSLRFEQVSVRPLGQRHALAVGRFVLTGGGLPERSGWFSTVWESRPEGWRVIHDHTS